jgi:hypothetical protein
MTRRRLILAIVATVLCGVAWWQSLDRLSAEERLLVGTWTLGPNSGASRWHFWPDRRFAYGQTHHNGAVTTTEFDKLWFVRDGALVFDPEPNGLRRSLRPSFRRLGLPDNNPIVITYGLESITASEFILATPYQTRETWTRAPAD